LFLATVRAAQSFIADVMHDWVGLGTAAGFMRLLHVPESPRKLLTVSKCVVLGPPPQNTGDVPPSKRSDYSFPRALNCIEPVPILAIVEGKHLDLGTVLAVPRVFRKGTIHEE
jgi:hypothetical protein